MGNTALYGATEGESYFRGVAGERFAVRNSGAVSVVEGTGDHGCEYMTGGVVVVLGETGRNFAAGMSGGVAYVFDEAGTFEHRCNMAMVELTPVPDDEIDHANAYRQALEGFRNGRVKVVGDLTKFDAARLRFLIERHIEATGSSRGQALLNDWNASLAKFRKVMPVEYRQAMEKLALTEDQILEPAGA